MNDAVAIAHRDGILTAASLMVAAPAAADALALARATPSLRVGLHLVLVDGRPVLPPTAIPDLVDGDGRFRDDMAAAAAAMFFIPRVRRQLAAEIAAQFDAFSQAGLALDHVNAHKHFHLHPTIAGLILETGARHGLGAVRLPIEPHAVLAGVETSGGSPGWLLQPWARLARRRLRRTGLLTPDQVFGLRWSGAMSERRLLGLLDALPEGLTEIYLHPATHDRFPGAAAGYRYREELAALTAPAVTAAVGRPGLTRGGFGDFAL